MPSSAGVFVAAKSGAHLNPAVTFGLLLNGKKEYAPGVAVDFGSTLTYFGGELLGAFLGAVVMWLAYKQHFDVEPEPASKLGVFSTGPAIRSTPWNLITEIIGTFVLVFVILTFGGTPSRARPAGRGPAGCRHRCFPRRPHRLRHQPRP